MSANTWASTNLSHRLSCSNLTWAYLHCSYNIRSRHVMLIRLTSECKAISSSDSFIHLPIIFPVLYHHFCVALSHSVHHWFIDCHMLRASWRHEIAPKVWVWKIMMFFFWDELETCPQFALCHICVGYWHQQTPATTLGTMLVRSWMEVVSNHQHPKMASLGKDQRVCCLTLWLHVPTCLTSGDSEQVDTVYFTDAGLVPSGGSTGDVIVMLKEINYTVPTELDYIIGQCVTPPCVTNEIEYRSKVKDSRVYDLKMIHYYESEGSLKVTKYKA